MKRRKEYKCRCYPATVLPCATGEAIEYRSGDGHSGGSDGVEEAATDANPVMIYRRLRSVLVRAPYSRAIYDATGTQCGYTLWSYDNYSQSALQDAPGMVGHDSSYGTGFVYRGNLTSVNRWLNTSKQFVDTLMAYDIAGNVVSVRDPNGNVTRMSYNDDGSNQYAFATATTNALGQVSSSGYDYAIGKAVYAIDLNGQKTSWSIPPGGR